MAGGDIRNMNGYLAMEPFERKVVFERRVHDLNMMMLALKRMDKPVIASVQGAAAGAGMSFLLYGAFTARNRISAFAYACPSSARWKTLGR